MSTLRLILAVLFVVVCCIALWFTAPILTLAQVVPVQLAILYRGWWIPVAVVWYFLTCGTGLIMFRLCVDATTAIRGPHQGKRS